MTPQNILLPVDGSEGSYAAIRYAKEIAEKFGSNITLLTVVDIETRNSIHEFYAYDPVIEEALQKRGQKVLEEMAKELEGVAHQQVIVTGRPADQILTYAEENPVDLIIMSTKGLATLARFFLGSVTNYVIHHAKIPVLTIPMTEYDK